MKNNKKYIGLFLAIFVFFSSSVSSFAYSKNLRFLDGGVISGPMLATVVTLGVASGIILSNNDDIYDLGRMFYDKYKENWSDVNALFNACVVIGSNQVVSVGSDFLNLCKDFFDSVTSEFTSSEESSLNYVPALGIPFFSSYLSFKPYYTKNGSYCISYGESCSVGNLLFKLVSGSISSSACKYEVYLGQVLIGSATVFKSDKFNRCAVVMSDGKPLLGIGCGDDSGWYTVALNSLYSVLSIPYSNTYNPDGVLDKENLDVYVPSNLKDIVGVSSDKVIRPGVDSLNPPYDLPFGGTVTFPNVDNPAIDIDDVLSFPLGGVLDPPIDTPIDPPIDTPIDSVLDWVVSLVVPSDTYWIDKFNHFRNVFLGKFPGLDMTPLEQLAVGETPFPNIDVSIMGAKLSRILDSDRTINSVVSFFRPLIQGFISIFLLLYAYKEIYFLIRGTRPFDASGSGGVIK